VKSGRLGLTEHVVLMGERRNLYTIMVQKCLQKWPIVRPRMILKLFLWRLHMGIGGAWKSLRFVSNGGELFTYKVQDNGNGKDKLSLCF